MLPYMATLKDPKSRITPHLKLLALNKTLTLVHFNIKLFYIVYHAFTILTGPDLIKSSLVTLI